MKLWKCSAGTLYFYKLSYDIGEAHIEARQTFGPGVSFTVREATPEEFETWVLMCRADSDAVN